MDIFLSIVQMFWGMGIKDTALILVLFLLPWVFILWQAYFWINYFETYSTNKLKNEYQESLKMLGDNPKNRLLRQQAVIAGRMYYGSLRPDGIPNMYDELTIDKHIRATAGSLKEEEQEGNEAKQGFSSSMTEAEIVQGAVNYIRKAEI